MKKIICLLLAVCTLSFPTVYADENDNLGKSVEFLDMLGIVSDYDADNLPEDDQVTRAVFAESVARMINADKEVSENVYYHDVSKEHWAFNYISVLTEKKIISGDGEKNFRPDDVITRNEAAKILLSLMGYDSYAALDGGFPSGYLKLAVEVGLFKGCSNESMLTYGDMFRMTENALKCATASVIFTNGDIGLTKDEDTTLLGKYYDMYYEKGVVDGANEVNIANSEALAEGIVRIDGVDYDSEIDAFDWLGCEVEFVYHDDGSGELELVWINPLANNDILEISADFDCNFDDEQFILEYPAENSSKTKKARLNSGITVVYNGEIVDTGIEEIFKADRYSLKLVRGKSDRDYSLAVVWAYENYVVGSIDSENKIVYDRRDPSENLVLDDEEYDYCGVFSGGLKKEFKDIAEKNVISVYKSKSGKRVKVDIWNMTVSGTVRNILNDSNGETRIVLTDGTEYACYLKNAQLGISVGEEITLYTDAEGFAVYAEREGNDSFFGYIIKTYIEDAESVVYIKLLNDSGTIATYKVRDKAKLDGDKYDSEALYSILEGRQQLAAFKTNKDGEITYIDTVDKGNEDSTKTLTEYQSKSLRRYKAIGRLGTTLLIDNGTKIFSVDTNADSGKSIEERFTVKSKSDLRDDGYYTSQAFRLGTDDRVFEEVLVIEDADWNSTADNEPCVLISSVEEVINDADELVELVSGYKNGEAVSFYTDGLYSAIKNDIAEGDIVRIQQNSKGQLAGCEMIYDYDKKTAYNKNDTYARFSARRMYANDKVEKALKVGYNDGSTFDEIFNLSSAGITVFDSSAAKGRRVRTGNMGDIKTYKMAGSNCSEVFVQTYNTNIITVIVYK